MISLGGVAKTGSLVEVAPGFRPFAYVEMRTRRRGAQAARRPPLNTWLVSWWLPAAIRSVKASAFAEGSVPAWLPALRGVPLLGRALDGGAAAITERRFFVNRYGPATPGRPRLSFTYYELVDFAAFPGAVAALLALARDFRARTGWAPGALAVYFVRRGGNKETSNYAGPKGISCTLDPVTVRGTEVFGFFFSRSLSFLSFFFSFFQRLASFFFPSSKGSPLCSLETPSPSLHPLLLLSLSLSLQGAPGDPRFRQFLAESDALIQSLGGRLSPSQSLPSALDGGNRDAAADFGGLDQSLVSGAGGDRFATPYLRRVFAADARAQELKKAGMWEAAVGAQRG